MASIQRSGDRWRVGTQYYSTYDAAKAATSGSTSTSGTTTKTSTPIDYNFYADRETAEEYNARIAAARGDSAESLANMQNVTKTTFANQGLNYQALPTATAPTSTSQIQPFNNVNVPTNQAYTPGVTNAVAGMAGLSDYVTSQQTAIEQEAARRLAAEKANQEQSQSLVDKLLGGLKSPGEAGQDAWEDTGIDQAKYFAEQRAGIKEIEKLNEEYNEMKAMRDQQIAATADRFGTVDFANNRMAQIERNAAPRLNEISANINAKAATLEALQGNYAQARQYVNDAIQAATADAKFKFDMFSTFYALNQDAFDRTESIYREAYETSMATAEQEYNRQYELAQQLGEWMIKYPTAGVTMQDSFQSAVGKVSSVAGQPGTPDLTADQKNYFLAVDQGYEGSFADWLGKGGSGTDGLAMALFLGQIGIGDVPQEQRNEVLRLYNDMQALQTEQNVDTTTSIDAGIYKATTPELLRVPQSNYSGSPYQKTQFNDLTTALVNGAEAEYWGGLFGINN